MIAPAGVVPLVLTIEIQAGLLLSVVQTAEPPPEDMVPRV